MPLPQWLWGQQETTGWLPSQSDTPRTPAVLAAAIVAGSFFAPPLPPDVAPQSVYPDAVARSPVQQPQAFAGSLAPERTSPLAVAVYPDRVDRPVFAAWQQLAWVTSPKPERTALLTDVQYPARIEHRPSLPASQQWYSTEQFAVTTTAVPATVLGVRGVLVDGSQVVAVPTRSDLVVYQGEDTGIQVTIVNSAGAPVNLAGYSARLVVKDVLMALLGNPRVFLTYAGSITNSNQGIVQFVIPGSDLKKLSPVSYWWDVFLTSPSGMRDEVVPTGLMTVALALGA